MFPLEIPILIVDDSSTSRALTKRHLKEMGFKNFVEASEIQSAWKVLEERSALKDQAVQMILSDLVMPNGTGVELLTKVRTSPKFSPLPFIMITAEGADDQLLNAVAAGVDAYILKMDLAGTIKEKISEVFQRRTQEMKNTA